MTTAKPLARYSAIKGALANGFATAELHHLWGHDPLRHTLGPNNLASSRWWKTAQSRRAFQFELPGQS
ncbi:hypothetical protein NKJ46_27565 [Mesorhizobium sp. M0166]|uniref:hypothetical protein n=1 Tax=unclassified Mesorhizobium TaxID=325217 RepID=UPI003339C392